MADVINSKLYRIERHICGGGGVTKIYSECNKLLKQFIEQEKNEVYTERFKTKFFMLRIYLSTIFVFSSLLALADGGTCSIYKVKIYQFDAQVVEGSVRLHTFHMNTDSLRWIRIM